ncbi:MAG: polyphosphate kinase 2 [Saprospiraceae bacterium]|nr:polyphosphate kinase 2 [Saprospiraceae bacterium]
MTKKNKNKFSFSEEQLASLQSRKDLLTFLEEGNGDLAQVRSTLKYEQDLQQLQEELLKLQNWIHLHKKRVVVVFEGRDAAGKGGAIRRFSRYLNPRSMRVVALNKPTDIERGQWYFRRHVKELPNPGEIVFFDRSWYNRAVVEPVMGFCTMSEYQEFIRQVPEFEHMLFENGVDIVKFWFSISQEEQSARFKSRQTDPLKQWKLSPVDLKAQEFWDEWTHYKEEMFSKTHTSYAPWIIIKSNNKKQSRLESIRYLLSKYEYDGKEKSKTVVYPDPNIVQRFNRSMLQLD